MASTSGSMGEGRRQRNQVGKKRRLKEQGQRQEIVPTVSLPIGETHAATRSDLRRLSTRILGKQELKWIDVYAANSSLSANSSTTVFISPVPQGTTSITRIGSSCQITSVQLKCDFHMQAANTASSPPAIRVLVLCDSEVNGALPATADVLDTTTITDITLAPYNITQLGPKQRFKILYDYRGHLQITARDSSASPFYIYDDVILGFKKPIKRRLQYGAAATSGAIAGCIKNSIILMLMADTASVLVNYGTRVIFKDD